MMDLLVGLDEVAMLEEIDMVNDMDQDWIDDRSEPEVEFEPEAEQTREQELTNLRVLEWLHDLPTDPKETILIIQDVDKDGIKYVSHDNTESNWVAPDGPLRVPQSNLDLLDFGRSTGTSMDIFVREVGVGLTHTDHLIIKKLKSARKTGELETEGENAKKPPFGRIFESYFDLPNHYSNNIVITDSDFILTERTCTIAITADVSFKTGLGEQSNHRLGEMPLPVQPAQPLIGAKRQRDGPGPSHSVDSPTAAPPPKRVRVSKKEIQTSDTIETLEKKERDQSELCAKLQEYRAIARERNEWKKKYEDLQVAYKEDEIKHLKELYMAKVSQVSQEVLATMKSSEGSSDTRPKTRVQELCASREPETLSRYNSLLPVRRTRYLTLLTPISLLSSKNHSTKCPEQQWMRSTEPLGGHWVGSFLPNVVIIHPIARSEHPAR